MTQLKNGPRLGVTSHTLFVEARQKADLGNVKIHDLRGTFCMHRAMVVENFRRLQAELGHSSASAVQSYLDNAGNLDRVESIFFTPGQQEEGQ